MSSGYYPLFSAKYPVGNASNLILFLILNFFCIEKYSSYLIEYHTCHYNISVYCFLVRDNDLHISQIQEEALFFVLIAFFLGDVSYYYNSQICLQDT